MTAVRPFETFATLTVLREQRRVELIRTAEPFADGDELRGFWAAAIARVADLPTGEWCVLTDLRPVRGRNDEDFDRLMTRYRRPFYAHFNRSAVVVRTVVGRLHVSRSTEEDGAATRVFDDLDAARAWLLGA